MKIYLPIIGGGVVLTILVWILLNDPLLKLFLTLVILFFTVVVPTLFMFMKILSDVSMRER